MCPELTRLALNGSVEARCSFRFLSSNRHEVNQTDASCAEFVEMAVASASAAKDFVELQAVWSPTKDL